MNNVSLDSEATAFFAAAANETTISPTSSPTTSFDGLGESLTPTTPQQRVPTSNNSVMTILFLLGCLGIAVLWAVIAARNYQSPRIADEEEEDHHNSLEDLEKQILQHFDEKGNQTVLKKDNFLEDVTETDASTDDSSSSDENGMTEIDLEAGVVDDDDDNGHITIQRTMQDGQTKQVTAPNLCTICLENYQPGDTVTWSTNDACPHVYHQVCVATFFAHGKKKGRKSCLCPTCRQEYITLPQNNNNITSDQTGGDQTPRRLSPILVETNAMRQQRISVASR